MNKMLIAIRVLPLAAILLSTAVSLPAKTVQFRYTANTPSTTRADFVFDCALNGSPLNIGAGATLNLEHEWAASFLSGLNVRWYPADVNFLDDGADSIKTESAASFNFQPYIFLGGSSLERTSTRLLIASRHMYGNYYMNSYVPVDYFERTANGVRLGLDLKIRDSRLENPRRALYVGYQYLENSDVEIAMNQAGGEPETYGHGEYTALGVNALVGELADTQFGLDFWFKFRFAGFVATMDLGYSGGRGLIFGLGLGFSLGSGGNAADTAAAKDESREAD